MKVKSLSRVRLLATPGTAAHQTPPSMGFSRQEYWSGVPLPSPIILVQKLYITVIKSEGEIVRARLPEQISYFTSASEHVTEVHCNSEPLR